MSSEMEGRTSSGGDPYGAIVRKGAGGMRYADGARPHVGDEVSEDGGAPLGRVCALLPERGRVQVLPPGGGPSRWADPSGLVPAGRSGALQGPGGADAGTG